MRTNLENTYQRAYAPVELKTEDGSTPEERFITGIATTPTTDRIGDVIEPLGVLFKNPMPLLLYHDAKQPVGTVELDRPTKNGITFRARIARISTPGRLAERVEEAWQSVKSQLIRGVSIGFRALPEGIEELKDATGRWTGGFRFTKTEVLELSLVAIPANMDASIATIKSYADGSTSATGDKAVSSQPARRRELESTRGSAMNYSEEIKSRTAELQTKTTRLEALMSMESPDAAAQEEAANLPGEIKALNQRIDQLSALEQANFRLGAPIMGRTVSEAQVSRAPGNPSNVTVKPNLPQGIEFARYVISLIAARGNPELAMSFAKSRYPDNPRIQMLHRAAVAGGTTTDATWAGPLVEAQTLASEFIEFLRPKTVIGKFGQGGVPSLRNVPFNVRLVGQTSGGSATWVGQAVQKPLTKFDFNATSLTWAKIAAITVFSEELARFSTPSAETYVRDGLAAAIIERMDTDFLDPSKAAVLNVSPASITNAATPVVSSGTDADAIRADLRSLVSPFVTANIDMTQAVWIMPTTTALNLSLLRNALGQKEFPDITMNGGTFEGLPVITSQYAAIGSPVSNQVVLVAANEIFLSDDGAISIDASREASLEMSDDPANESGTVVSMFQTNQIAVRAERFVNWAVRRAAAVQYIADANWGEGSPA